MKNFTHHNISILAENSPTARAWVKGNSGNPQLYGKVDFYDTPFGGTIVNAEIYGLPSNSSGFYGMHIHEIGNCTLPFDKTGGHYNPNNTPHPEHSGDLPPLPGNMGYAWIAFYTQRFNVKDIVDKSIVIHNNKDDFTTQPAGNSGDKIGCGVIAIVNN